MKLSESKNAKLLRREIAIGIKQANRGDLAPLDIKAVKGEVRRRLNKKRNSWIIKPC